MAEVQIFQMMMMKEKRIRMNDVTWSVVSDHWSHGNQREVIR